MSSPTSTDPTPVTVRPKRSTAASNTYAAPPSASATCTTTSPDHCSTPAASDPEYTLFCDEPVIGAVFAITGFLGHEIGGRKHIY